MGEALARTPLFARHRDAGAKIVPFAGWEMPVVYGSIIEEHRAVRTSAGLFDVSHMGEVRVRGPQAVAFAQRLFTNDVAGMDLGRVRYGLLCLEDGGVVDDVTLYRVAQDELLFCVNASNIANDLAWMRETHAAGRFDCELIDESEATALLAIQGPKALEIAKRAIGFDGPAPGRWRFRTASFAGLPIWLSRTGYTGEDGFEIYVPNEGAVRLWDALLAAGQGELQPIGLGARDTLRVEMGYPLYGHELDRGTDPIEAQLDRFVAFGTGFTGEAALAERKRRGPSRKLVGLVLEGRSLARTDFPIHAGSGLGRVTSGTFGPSVERSIAIGYVPADHASPGTRVEVEIRGRRSAAEVVEMPFYRKEARRKG
jgi:aminomethyltransferase